MKKNFYFLIPLIISFICLASKVAYAESCDVVKLIGTQATQGTYRINVKRESDNLYKITGQEIYIKTQMCLNLAIGDDAILEINQSSGAYVYGEIHFLN